MYVNGTFPLFSSKDHIGIYLETLKSPTQKSPWKLQTIS